MFCPPIALSTLEHFGIDVVVVVLGAVVVVDVGCVPALNGEVTVVGLKIGKAGDVPMVIG